MSWDKYWEKFLWRFRLDYLLVPNLIKMFKTASWRKIPVLFVWCVVFLPSIVLLTLIDLLIKKPGGR
jgi:hypothetical protein